VQALLPLNPANALVEAPLKRQNNVKLRDWSARSVRAVVALWASKMRTLKMWRLKWI